jgi:predicted nucleotidyltransferase
MGIDKKVDSKTKPKVDRPKGMIDALFTSTQQKVFGLIFGQPDRKFFATELIELAGKGSGGVQRELAKLTESGLVNIEAVGKQKYYQANASSPIFEELCRITQKTMGLVEPLTEALLKIGLPIELALVYGSIAKGTAKAGSDIDLLVISDEVGLENLYEVLGPVEGLLSRKINPTLYNKSEFENRIASENPFLKKLLEGETIPLIGDKHGFTAAR